MTREGGGIHDELVALARAHHIAPFIERAGRLPPADLGDVIASLGAPDQVRLMTTLPAELCARALAAMPDAVQAERILSCLEPSRAALLVDHLADDDAVNLLGALAVGPRELILRGVRDRRPLESLLQHPGDSAGGLMTTRMFVVGELDVVGLALEAVRRQARHVEGGTEVFVIDVERRLVGVLSFKQLIVTPATSVVRDVMDDASVRVSPEMSRGRLNRLMGRYDVPSLPVVDGDGRLIGRVTFDDVRDAAEAEATEDLLRLGGVSAGERLDATWIAAVKSRLPGLYVTLLTAFLAAAVVYFFKASIERIVALAVWMPIVAGMGGNAGTQALAVSARRASLGMVPDARARELIRKEMLVGVTNGAAIGVLVAALSVLLGESWRFGLVVFLAMAGNLLIAGAAGAALPVFLKRSGRNPALASSILVTTLTDVCGLGLLLGLATALLLP